MLTLHNKWIHMAFTEFRVRSWSVRIFPKQSGKSKQVWSGYSYTRNTKVNVFVPWTFNGARSDKNIITQFSMAFLWCMTCITASSTAVLCRKTQVDLYSVYKTKCVKNVIIYEKYLTLKKRNKSVNLNTFTILSTDFCQISCFQMVCK